jgi:molybdenum cofactor cytidylyltransferase
MIAAVVLAAGRSTRMGRPKMLLPLADGRPMLAHTVETMERGGVQPIVVVTGGEAGVAEAAEAAGAEWVQASGPGGGDMLSSIQSGLRALEGRQAEGGLVVPGDMPFIRPTTIRTLVQVLMTDRPRLVAPSYARRRGHPVGLAREVWPEVMALAPPQSLRDYLRQRSGEIRYVVVDDPGILKDLDRPDDYDHALDREKAS